MRGIIQPARTESPDRQTQRNRPESLIRGHTMLRMLSGPNTGYEAQAAQPKIVPVASVSSSSTSSVMFVAQAVNRLKQLSTENIAVLEAAPGVRPRRRSRVVADEGPTDLRKQDQPASTRWLPSNLWSKLLWLKDCLSAFRLLPYAIMQARALPDSSQNKNEWMAW